MKANKRIAIGFSSSAYNILKRLKSRKHANLIALTPSAASKIDIDGEDFVIDKAEKIFQRFWEPGNTFLTVGAIGAIVRIISPLIASKEEDPAIIAMDFNGKNIIPILGSHKAGAERLSIELAEDLGGEYVSTGFSYTEGIIPIDSFGTDWGWERTGEGNKWSQLMIQNCMKQPISITQTAGRNFWSSSQGAAKLLNLSKKNNFANNSIGIKICSEASNCCSWHPATLWIGIGCEKNTSKNLLERALLEAFKESGLAKESIAGLATINIKANELAIKSLKTKKCLPLRLYTAKELSQISVPNPSSIVKEEVGTASVAEASSLIAAGEKSVLRFAKHIYHSQQNEKGAVTIAISESELAFAPHKGELHLVGSGPGDISYLSNDARLALSKSVIWIGYKRYLDLLEPIRRFDQVRIESALTHERARCEKALQLAIEGTKVSLISSGDSGIYGMAGLALELWLKKEKSDRPIFKIHPGISSLQIAAAKIGAPLMHDFCAISLSDCLTPWEKIKDRIKAAALSDFVIAFYNPKSKERNWQLKKAFEILRETRSHKTPVVLARQLGREEEEITIHDLGSMPFEKVDMLSLVLVGNSSSFIQDGLVVTPRGY